MRYDQIMWWVWSCCTCVLCSLGGGDVSVESSADGSEDGNDVYDGTLPHRQQRSDTDSTHFCLFRGGTAAAVPLPLRHGEPALCGSHPLVTPYYCRLGNLLCFLLYVCDYCGFYVICVLYVPSVLWYCWLGLLTFKNRFPYNLYCVGGDVKHCSIQSNLSVPFITVFRQLWWCLYDGAVSLRQQRYQHSFVCLSLLLWVQLFWVIRVTGRVSFIEKLCCASSLSTSLGHGSIFWNQTKHTSDVVLSTLMFLVEIQQYPG